ncbi:exported hypothetical protein [Candidatus Sulfopaludibacter sp. SbA3]|nr:exported hypothetical protein [Candidatus Sulfopaludibacter sp. SbA3]
MMAIAALPAKANLLTSATATANCQGYSLTVNAADLTVGTSYTINYSLTVTCGSGSPVTIPGTITFTATASTATETVTGGTWNGMSLSNSCQVYGSATLTTSGSTVFININGTNSDVPVPLMCSTLALACPLSSGTVGVPYSSAWVATGGIPPYAFSEFTYPLPPGLTAAQIGASNTLTGTPTTAGTYSTVFDVTDSAGNIAVATCGITIAPATPQPVCSTGNQPITYNLHESSQNASEIVWFNSHFKLQGNLPTSAFTVTVANGTITFGTVTLTVPNAVITFSSTATCASTTFNTSANQWQTTLPLSAAQQVDEIFAAGLAYVLPASFPQNIQGVTWTADFEASVPSLQFQWQWGAANYVSSDNKGDVFPMSSGAPDYNGMMIDPGHNVTTCAGYNNGDHAGTPENAMVKALVVGGGSGGGGSNWTGSWSSTGNAVCQQ